MRFSATSDYADVWLLSYNAVYFYNLFFAYIALIVGQSIAITFLFERSRIPFLKRSHRRISIVNDQKVLNWCFLNWFSKLSLTIGMLFFDRGYHAINLYQDYAWLIVLLIIVLFLHPWLNIRLVYKRQSLKWMGGSTLIISCLALGLANINLIDYKGLNHFILSKNVDYVYDLQLPKSNAYDRPYERAAINDIYLVFSKTDTNYTLPLILFNNEEVQFKDLVEHKKDFLSPFHERALQRNQMIKYQLHVHEKIKLNYLKSVEHILADSIYYTEIGYAISPQDRNIQDSYRRIYFYKKHLLPIKGDPFFDKWHNENKDSSTSIEVRQLINGKYKIKNEIVEEDELKGMIKKYILELKESGFYFYPNTNLDFESYFNVLSAHREIFDEVIDSIALEKYGTHYSEDLDIVKRREILSHLSTFIIEMKD